MLINFPGTIRVANLATEFAPLSETLRDIEAESLTSVEVSLTCTWGNTSAQAPNERRHMQYPGSLTADEFSELGARLMNMLVAHGVEGIEELEISFQAWRGSERAQVWGEDGFIHRMFFDPTPKEGGTQKRVRRPGSTIRYRPHEQEVNIFAVLFGHDD
jgi:hypothetical protein